jgi:adenylate kinase family enzyme
MAEITAKGQLLPDELVLRLLQRRLQDGAAAGERGVLLDGFPRTRAQAVRFSVDRARKAQLRASTALAAETDARGGGRRRACWTRRSACRWRST